MVKTEILLFEPSQVTALQVGNQPSSHFTKFESGKLEFMPFSF